MPWRGRFRGRKAPGRTTAANEEDDICVQNVQAESDRFLQVWVLLCAHRPASSRVEKFGKLRASFEQAAGKFQKKVIG